MSQNGGDASIKDDVLTAEEEVEAKTLLDHGISKIVAKELLGIYKTGEFIYLLNLQFSRVLFHQICIKNKKTENLATFALFEFAVLKKMGITVGPILFILRKTLTVRA